MKVEVQIQLGVFRNCPLAFCTIIHYKDHMKPGEAAILCGRLWSWWHGACSLHLPNISLRLLSALACHCPILFSENKQEEDVGRLPTSTSAAAAEDYSSP